MTDMSMELTPVKVEVTNQPGPKEVVTSIVKVTAQVGAPALLLAHSPNRHRAILYFTDNNAIITDSFGRASNLDGLPMATSTNPLELHGTSEVWVAAALAGPTTVYVISETEN